MCGGSEETMTKELNQGQLAHAGARTWHIMSRSPDAGINIAVLQMNVRRHSRQGDDKCDIRAERQRVRACRVEGIAVRMREHFIPKRSYYIVLEAPNSDALDFTPPLVRIRFGRAFQFHVPHHSKSCTCPNCYKNKQRQASDVPFASEAHHE
jgi:hypothetical protein